MKLTIIRNVKKYNLNIHSKFQEFCSIAMKKNINIIIFGLEQSV